VYQVTKDKKNFHKAILTIILSSIVLISFFSLFCSSVWGSKVEVVITNSLPHNLFTWVIKILYVVNLMFSFHIQINPLVLIIENEIYKGWRKTDKLTWCKNFDRMLIVGVSVLLCYKFTDKGEKLISLIGALPCTMFTLTLPAVIHLKVCAESWC